VLSFIVYLPRLRQLLGELRAEVTMRGVFALLGNIFVALFLVFDNASVVMMMLGHSSYRTIRRVSYSIFLLGIVWQLIAMAIVLRHSFGEESDLKKQLEEMTPVQFLERLNQID
jgi:tellurite resistance protein TehA-like permease